MKKIISIMLALVMLLSFAACNKEKEPSTPQDTVSLDVKELKKTWQDGALMLPNGKTVKIPCTVTEFIEQSGLEIANENVLGDKTLSPKETVILNVASEDINFKITVRNTTSKNDLSYKDANVVEYNFNNTNEANRQIKFAGSLTPGVTRKSVEKALGVPKGQKSEDALYYYTDKNSEDKDIQLVVSFNSDDIVNSVSYKILFK